MGELIGRRRDDVQPDDDRDAHLRTFLEQAGDYCLGTIDDHGENKRCLWFLLPLHESEGIFARGTEGSGLHCITEPPWTFRECDDGSIEVRASILCGRTDQRPEGYFHGWLNEGHRWTW